MKKIHPSSLLLLAILLLNCALADNDPNRKVDSCIVPNYAKILSIPSGSPGNGITGKTWRQCFADVKPAANKHPSGKLQQQNKAVQFNCLKQLAPTLSKEMVDKVMNSCRPEGDVGMNHQHGYIQ